MKCQLVSHLGRQRPTKTANSGVTLLLLSYRSCKLFGIGGDESPTFSEVDEGSDLRAGSFNGPRKEERPQQPWIPTTCARAPSRGVGDFDART
jgi:hypothetical protein